MQKSMVNKITKFPKKTESKTVLGHIRAQSKRKNLKGKGKIKRKMLIPSLWKILMFCSWENHGFFH